MKDCNWVKEAMKVKRWMHEGLHESWDIVNLERFDPYKLAGPSGFLTKIYIYSYK